MNTATLFRAYDRARFKMWMAVLYRGYIYGIGVSDDDCALEYQRYARLLQKLETRITARLADDADQKARADRLEAALRDGLNSKYGDCVETLTVIVNQAAKGQMTRGSVLWLRRKTAQIAAALALLGGDE